MSLLERVVNDLLQCYLNMQADGRAILHHNEKHVLGAIDHEVDAGGAVPFDLPERARRRRHSVTGIGADAEAIAKSETVAGVVEIVALDARVRSDVIGGHRRKRRMAEKGLAVQRSAIQQHLAVT